MEIVSICRVAHFNAAHRLYVDSFSEEKNFETFGKCSNPFFHGHNYELIVRVKGPVDPTTGFVMSISELKDIIEEDIEDYLDHKNLNLEVPEFKTIVPTAENIAIVIWNRLRRRIKPSLKLKVTLYETPRNFVEYKG
ncbi:MAG: 6-pyruvoyl tetrahydrobiopterin synthase [Flavobacteriaceae bacterium]|nr:MAG: 6-pyruvoyl tetrahydrobiopterin synthase [Flavobacteriaceae bacterium]